MRLISGDSRTTVEDLEEWIKDIRSGEVHPETIEEFINFLSENNLERFVDMTFQDLVTLQEQGEARYYERHPGEAPQELVQEELPPTDRQEVLEPEVILPGSVPADQAPVVEQESENMPVIGSVRAEQAPEIKGKYPPGRINSYPQDYSKEKIYTLTNLPPTAVASQANILLWGYHRLPIICQKIVDVMKAKIDLDDRSFYCYSLTLQDVRREIKSLRLSKEAFDKAMDTLLSYVIRIPISGGEVRTTYLQAVIINDDKDKVLYRFSDDLMPFLLQLKGDYTSMLKDQKLRCRGPIEGKLYDILRSYVYQGRVTIRLKKFRNMLCMGENEHRRFSNFRSRVLEPFKEACVARHDFTFEYEAIRKQGRVTAIKFYSIKLKKEYRKIKYAGEASPMIQDEHGTFVPI